MDARDRILDYLQEHRTTTIPDLSTLCGLTRADIRHHINNLIKEGLVEKGTHVNHLQGRRGRPECVYHLSSSSGDGNYHNLCAVLLKTILRDNLANQQDVLAVLAQEIVGNHLPAASLTHTMNSIVTWLNQRGYHARWEAAAAGPRIMFLHCPYAVLLPEHTELCQLDTLVLEKLLSLKIRQTAQMDFGSNKNRACIFELGDNLNNLKLNKLKPKVIDS